MMRLRRAVLSALLPWMLTGIPAPPALADPASEDGGSAETLVPAEHLPDKMLHGLAGASAALLSGSIAAACTVGADPGTAAAITGAAALGAAAAVGLAKELLDMAGAGNPELADFLWALAGGAAAAAAACAFVYDQAPGNEPSLLGAPLACFGLVLAIPVADSWCRSRLRARRSRGY